MFPESKGDGTVLDYNCPSFFFCLALIWITKEMVFLVLDLILSGGIACLVRYIRDFNDGWLAFYC